MPTPPVMSNEVSPFSTPLPSPHFSPYSQPNHSQVSESSSILNPFRRGAAEDNMSAVSIELNNRGLSATDGMDMRAPRHTGPVPVVVTPPPMAAGVRGPGFAPGSGPGSDPRMARSPRVSQEHSSGPFPHRSNTYAGSGLHKSASMQQLGSRPAPPPPSLSAPIPSISISLPSSRSSPPSSAGVLQTPTLSLDSLIDPASAPTSPSSPKGGSFIHSPQPTHPGSESVVVLQSGAERLPALTVPERQSMLRHSASVPQMFISSPLSTSPPITPLTRSGPSASALAYSSSSLAQRNLPPGFESSPVTGS